VHWSFTHTPQSGSAPGRHGRGEEPELPLSSS
jgi:hypothetical protein